MFFFLFETGSRLRKTKQCLFFCMFLQDTEKEKTQIEQGQKNRAGLPRS